MYLKVVYEDLATYFRTKVCKLLGFSWRRSLGLTRCNTPRREKRQNASHGMAITPRFTPWIKFRGFSHAYAFHTVDSLFEDEARPKLGLAISTLSNIDIREPLLRLCILSVCCNLDLSPSIFTLVINHTHVGPDLFLFIMSTGQLAHSRHQSWTSQESPSRHRSSSELSIPRQSTFLDNWVNTPRGDSPQNPPPPADQSTTCCEHRQITQRCSNKLVFQWTEATKHCAPTQETNCPTGFSQSCHQDHSGLPSRGCLGRSWYPR